MKNKYMLIGVIVAVAGLYFGIMGFQNMAEERAAGREYEDLLHETSSEGQKLQEQESTMQPSGEDAVSSESEQMPDAGAPTEENIIAESGDSIGADTTQSQEGQRVETRDDIDFEALQELNPDIYAWIEVPGTDVDYPIVQHAADNSYYLTHTIEHKQTTAASIYTENYNSKDFNDHHTVIYGHNMKNGTMFRSLHNFEDYDFFEEHRDIIIYMPDQTRYYKIFAAYTYDNRHLLHSYYCEEAESFQQYLDEIFDIKDFNAFIDRDMEVTSEDHIITLSTCVNSGDLTQRYLVQAVLIN